MKRNSKLFFLSILFFFFIGFHLYADERNIDLTRKSGNGTLGTRSVVQIPVSAAVLDDNSSVTLTFFPPVRDATVSIEDVSTKAVVYSQEWNSSSELTIDLNGCKSGMYYLDVTIGGTVYEGEFDLN